MPSSIHANFLAGFVLMALGGCHSERPLQLEPSTSVRSDRCAPDPAVRRTISFERSPGGVLEIDAGWMSRHHCNARVVDVREPDEREAMRLPFGENVPMEQIAEVASHWDPSEPIVIVCRSGRRSARVARVLEDMGFLRAASLSGGMLMWSAAGYPIVRGPLANEHEHAAGPGPAGGAIARETIEAHLADPDRVRWVKAAALLMQGTRSCVDGRDERAVVGTPGGDAGELLLALAALERVRGDALDEQEIVHLLDEYLDAFGRFYLHTDDGALRGLADDSRFAAHVRRVGLDQLVRRPARELEPALLDALTTPAHVGCGHLRLVLEHPDEYGVRVELARALLRAVLRRLWQGDAIDFVILEGEHHETAVVNVRVDHAVHVFTRIPAVSPHAGGEELFVNHPEVSAWLREQNATFLFEVEPFLRDHPEHRAEYLRALDEMGAAQLDATLRHLARSLPVYDAHFTSGEVRVTGDAR
jgi:rhodanese-related sulfurtransferase